MSRYALACWRVYYPLSGFYDFYKMGSQYLSSSPLQPGSHWVADSLSASRESPPSEDLSEPFPGVPLSSWLSSPTQGAALWSVTGFSLLPPLPQGLEDHGVPHKWLSPGLMSQCLHIQFSMFSREIRKNPSTIYEMGEVILKGFTAPDWEIVLNVGLCWQHSSFLLADLYFGT